jgi:hypothetical protein
MNSLYVICVFECAADGIDGKQARRPQTSGPLGELFDHGLDSWTAFLIPTCMYSVFGRGVHSIPPLRMYFCLWNIFINFYLSHWEKHNTGVLFLPWGYDASMVVSWKILHILLLQLNHSLIYSSSVQIDSLYSVEAFGLYSWTHSSFGVNLI